MPRRAPLASILAVTSICESWLNCRALMSFEWPISVRLSAPVAQSHSLAAEL
jgi:hypothetical protein